MEAERGRITAAGTAPHLIPGQPGGGGSVQRISLGAVSLPGHVSACPVTDAPCSAPGSTSGSSVTASCDRSRVQGEESPGAAERGG